ncbi:MAG: hypothetical protein PVG91_11345 [Gammaproteobacteria bacterium]|jgi:hypothetical protein
MIKKAFALMLLVVCTGCTMPTSQATKDLEDAPKFTEAEKAEMTAEEKVAVYNESMSEEKDKLVCRREKRVGSHRMYTVCFTREEVEANRQSAQDAVWRAKGTLNGTAN